MSRPRSGGGANILSVAADYQHDFGGVKLIAGGGGEWAFTQYTPPAPRPATSRPGTIWVSNWAFGGWAVGASAAYYTNYAHAGYAATNAGSGDDGWVVTAGGSYTIDAWSFGLQGLYASYQQDGAMITGNPFATASNQDFWAVSLNGAYALGPGISLEAQLAYTDTDYGSVSAFGASARCRGRGRKRQPGQCLGNRLRHRHQFLSSSSSAVASGDVHPPPRISLKATGVQT